MHAEKRSDGFGGNIPAAREGDVRMKRPQLGLESRVDRGFLDAFVQLEKMRMAGPDADPKNGRASFAGKRPEPGDRKKKGFPRDGFQIFFETLFDIAQNVAEKTERQMHLLWREPTNTAQMRIQFREMLCNGGRKLEADEEPFRVHSWLVNSKPERDTSPSGPAGRGSNIVLITFIVLPAIFGKIALPRIAARAAKGIANDGAPRRQAEII